MASTNKTVNYELSQFEGTDKPSWEADYNADMLAIDTNLKAVSDVANGASGDISTLDGRLTTAEGNISTNANDIDALEARADALESGEATADGRLDALETEQIMQNTAIESNTRLGYNLARPYDSASTYAVGAYVLFQDTLYKCTTAISTGESFDPSKWLAIKATDEISSGGVNVGTMALSPYTFGTATGNHFTVTSFSKAYENYDYSYTIGNLKILHVSPTFMGTPETHSTGVTNTFVTVGITFNNFPAPTDQSKSITAISANCENMRGNGLPNSNLGMILPILKYNSQAGNWEIDFHFYYDNSKDFSSGFMPATFIYI